MTMAQFEKALAEELGWAKHEVVDLMDTMGDIVYKGLKDGEPVVIRHLGRYKIADRAARNGRNPATGEAIKIKASRKLKILPNKALKDRLRVK